MPLHRTAITLIDGPGAKAIQTTAVGRVPPGIVVVE
jgi:hypothetical protein